MLNDGGGSGVLESGSSIGGGWGVFSSGIGGSWRWPNSSIGISSDLVFVLGGRFLSPNVPGAYEGMMSLVKCTRADDWWPDTYRLVYGRTWGFGFRTSVCLLVPIQSFLPRYSW